MNWSNVWKHAVLVKGAGIAAAVSLKDKSSFSEVNISKVQKELARQNVRYL